MARKTEIFVSSEPTDVLRDKVAASARGTSTPTVAKRTNSTDVLRLNRNLWAW